MNTGERIKQLRKERGYSAEFIAEKVNLSPSTIYRYENNEIASLKIDTLKQIADILGTSACDLLGWSTDDTELSNLEVSLLSMFRQLNNDGQEFVLHTVEGLIASNAYIKTGFSDSVG